MVTALPGNVLTVKMEPNEIQQVQVLLDQISKEFLSSDDQDFINRAFIYSHGLPQRVRETLYLLKIKERFSGAVVSGLPIDDDEIGATPTYWTKPGESKNTTRYEFFHVLLSSLLGEPFGWANQQSGKIIHDILPIKEHESEQINSASKATIYWHTEDAFHPYRPDYVSLMCLRNDDDVSTTYADINISELDRNCIDILFEEKFIQLPDKSHLVYPASHVPERVKMAVLFGDRSAPYLRLDPYYMDFESIDADARLALEKLVLHIDSRVREIVLKPGDICFIDNYTAVHGRKSFDAKYNGRDRWLKRICITRDIRKSRENRSSPESRFVC